MCSLPLLHDILMSRAAGRIKDKRELYYICQMLMAGMMLNEVMKQKTRARYALQVGTTLTSASKRN